MARRFKRVNYEQSRQQTVTIGECLLPNHLAYFIVDMVAQLDLSSIYAQYAPVGGEAFAPEVLLGLLLYGYTTGYSVRAR
jgi:transposase